MSSGDRAVGAYKIVIGSEQDALPYGRFSELKEKLVKPLRYPEQLEWIRKSYESFFAKVREKESVVAACDPVE